MSSGETEVGKCTRTLSHTDTQSHKLLLTTATGLSRNTSYSLIVGVEDREGDTENE